MATAKKVSVLVLWFAIVCNYVGAAPRPRVRPVAGPDIYRGKNVAKDSLLPGEKVVNVMSLGAKPDGKFDCTEAFMGAWREACHSNVQARLLIPRGTFLVSTMFFAGPCQTPGPVTIQVIGTVLATGDISDYVNGEWLMFRDIAGIKLIGGGIFDGNGKAAWQFSQNCEADPTNQCVRSPSSIYFSNVTNGIIQNIKSVNPKGFHFFITNSANIRLRLLRLTAPDTSPNTDGLHVSHSINVKISKSTIETGDDCISMIQGVTNVAIKRVRCGPGHGISIGSLGKYPDEIEVRDVRVMRTTLIGTDNGLRIKTWPDKYQGAASKITFSNITMENVKNPIIIDQEYECQPNCQKKPSLVKLSDIIFRNIKGTTISPVAVDLRCSKQFPCQNVRLENIDLQLGATPTGSRCTNIKPIYVGLQKPPPCA
ncbi:unnamed protein product [Lathyrus oleraceus]|uniref:Exopolygalacturonase-like n=1 Tax=Pisum sativum TaxID=3888 RepID=A0A9D5BMF8_PEA|nr:hypothetical protein KIW84_014323 [Pisum sativum]